MKRLAAAIFGLLLPCAAHAQSQFPAHTIWGNPTASQALPTTMTTTQLLGVGTVGQCLLSGGSSAPTWGACVTGSGTITSITSTSNTLVPTGTTTVNLELKLDHANTWTAEQDYTLSQNGGTQVLITNSNAGGNAFAGTTFSNGTFALTIGHSGTNYTALSIIGASKAFLSTVGSPLVLNTGAPSQPVIFGVNNAEVGRWTSAGLTLSTVTGSTQCLHVNTSGVVSGTGFECGNVFPYNIKNYGAVGNGVADDTAAINAAIAAAQAANGSIVYFPAGTYNISSSLNITGAISLVGAGRNQSIINPTAFILAISITTDLSVYIHDLAIQYQTAGATSGAVGINVTSSATQNTGSRFQNLYIFGAYTAVNIQKAAYFVIDGCAFVNFTSTGITVANFYNADSGDNIITNSTLLSPGIGGTLIGILYNSGGGLRIVNNKINAVTHGIFLQYLATTLGSDLHIIGNSIEGVSMVNGFVATRNNSTGTYQNVIISNNNFEVMGSSGYGINIAGDPNGPWLSDVSISGNIFFLANAGAPFGMDISSTNGISALNNSFISNVAGTVAQFIHTTASTGLVGLSTKRGTFAASINGSGTTTTVTPF